MGLSHIVIVISILRMSQMVRVVQWFAQGSANSNICWSWDLTSDDVVQNSLVENSLECVFLPVVGPDHCVMKTQVVIQGIGDITHKNGHQGPTIHCLPQCVEERIIKVFNGGVTPSFRKSAINFSCAGWYLIGFMTQDFPKLGRTWLSNGMRVSLFSPS